MSKTTWIPKFVRMAAMAAGSVGFVTALALANGRMATANPYVEPAAAPSSYAADALSDRGPLGASCASQEGKPCLGSIMIHCSHTDGSFGHCFCVDGEFNCF